MYADSQTRGAAFELVLVGATTSLAMLLMRVARHPVTDVAVTAAATWMVLGGRSLEREALAVHHLIGVGDLDAARRRLRNLVGRDTTLLTADEMARAVVESVAENSSDAVVASYVWAAATGVPGLIAHRAANTLDAMVGHHNERYERFGWAAARFDDCMGYPAARAAGALTVLLATDHHAALRAWRRDARRHPSPNAGVVEAAFAGALGIRLGGTNTYYGNRVEHRAVMGDGRHPVPGDIPRATALARRVGLTAALSAAAVSLARGARRR